MSNPQRLFVPLAAGVFLGGWVVGAAPQQPARDPAAEAVKAQPVPEGRPEQKQTDPVLESMGYLVEGVVGSTGTGS